MKLKIFFLIIILLNASFGYSQQNSCADSSYRIKYIFGNNGSALFNNPDTSGKNYFTGSFSEGTDKGIAFLKTSWGDSILIAKKIIMNGLSWNSYFAPGGTLVCTGTTDEGIISKHPELMICRMDTNGHMLWAKRYRLINNHQYYKSGNLYTKNILIENNAIYVTAIFNGNFDVVAKLDLDGNIIWSKSFGVGTSNYSTGLFKPMYANNALLLQCVYGVQVSTDRGITGFTKLNEADGTLIESYNYKPSSNPSLSNMSAYESKYNSDNTISLTGFIEDGSSLDIFNTLLDGELNPIHNYYYKSSRPLSSSLTVYDFNRQKQHAFLFHEGFFIDNKYFITFGKNDEILRSRKFIIPPVGGNRYALNLDDKQNLHFLSQYTQNSKLITEYSRVSNFAPDGTLGCFGKDSSILTQYPFTISKQPFSWDNIQSNVLLSNDVPYTEDTAFVTKELVCKIVSYCDSLKITGPPTACVSQPVRYTVTRNNICQKFNDWAIDTSFANIVNIEGDSAITLSFKQPFTGYLYAALSDCVVKDSIFIKAVTPIKKILLPRQDSVLCPGKTLTLHASNGFTSYTWPGNSPGQSITVNSAGKYMVTALDSCNNSVTDSISVTLADTSLTLPVNQSICLYDTAFITLPPDVTNITWQPTASSLLRNNTIVAFPNQTTLYTITAQRLANCPINRFSLVTIKPCPRTFYIPNSFTPNADGKNDYFKPAISQLLVAYRFTIYNRYGQIVFETSSQTTGWDGTYRNSPQPMGGYIYYCTYRFNGGIQNTEKGYFMLIR